MQHLKLLTSKELQDVPDRKEIHTCGVVTTKQQPETANGVIFISLEDEEGEIQVIVYKGIWEKPHQRPVVLHSRLLAVKGRWQREDGVCNVIAGHLEDLTPMLGRAGDEQQGFQVML
ncbi:OB-fold nucleic acid binding domain-containing protein [Pelomonas sp. Root405]|uniref:OB-fold nucleic acid binding domain-containing protein n=1 Tax=Pelomonas sp. Root405 TaxID=1736529 RepID=UPI0012FB1F09|nr:OB-fold nucleic acid binding domain-containing protein [Pelomonas sp. Root405]